MPSQLCLILLGACIALGSLPLAAAPASDRMSVEQYEALKKEIEEQVEETTRQKFKDRETELALLTEPMKVGSRVTVRVRKANYFQEVEGTFRWINLASNPPLVQIGDQRININDIHELDRVRLRWGALQNSEVIINAEIHKRRQELEKDKDNFRRVTRYALLQRHGITPQWEQRHIRLGADMWEKSALGDGKIGALITTAELNDLAEIRIFNTTGVDFVAVFTLNDLPVATNMPVGASLTIPDVRWDSFVFWVFKKDLGTAEGMIGDFPGRFGMNVLKRDTGVWRLVPNAATRVGPESDLVDQKTCPECFGQGEVPAVWPGSTEEGAAPTGAAATPEGAAPAPAPVPETTAVPAVESPETAAARMQSELTAAAERSNTITCVLCQGKGFVQTSESQRVTQFRYTFRLVESQIQAITSERANHFIEQAQKVQKYQQQVDDHIFATMTKAREHRLANESAVLEEQEKLRREREQQEGAVALREQIMAKYDWMTPAEARQQSPRPVIEKTHRWRYAADDVNYPAVITTPAPERKNIQVDQLTSWRTPAEPVTISNTNNKWKLYKLQWRIVGGKVDGNQVYYLQYIVSVAHEHPTNNLRLKLAFTLEPGDDAAGEAGKRIVDERVEAFQPFWWGQYIGMIQIDFEALMRGFGEASITATEPN